MKYIILNGAEMLTKAEAHRHIANEMSFPGWYGNNLDALWDMLTTCGETDISLINAPALLNALDTYACRLLSCFYEAAEENSRLVFRVTDKVERPEDVESFEGLVSDAVEFLLDGGLNSVSGLQRHFRIGFHRAAKVMDTLEERGIVSPYLGTAPRSLLISREDWEKKK